MRIGPGRRPGLPPVASRAPTRLSPGTGRAPRGGGGGGARRGVGGEEEREPVPTLLLPPSAPPPSRDSTSHPLLSPGPGGSPEPGCPALPGSAASRLPVPFPAAPLAPQPSARSLPARPSASPASPGPWLLPWRAGPAPRLSRASRPQARPLLPAPPSSLAPPSPPPDPPPRESAFQPGQGLSLRSHLPQTPPPSLLPRGGGGRGSGEPGGKEAAPGTGKAPGRREEGGCGRRQGGGKRGRPGRGHLPQPKPREPPRIPAPPWTAHSAGGRAAGERGSEVRERGAGAPAHTRARGPAGQTTGS